MQTLCLQQGEDKYQRGKWRLSVVTTNLNNTLFPATTFGRNPKLVGQKDIEMKDHMTSKGLCLAPHATCVSPVDLSHEKAFLNTWVTRRTKEPSIFYFQAERRQPGHSSNIFFPTFPLLTHPLTALPLPESSHGPFSGSPALTSTLPSDCLKDSSCIIGGSPQLLEYNAWSLAWVICPLPLPPELMAPGSVRKAR